MDGNKLSYYMLTLIPSEVPTLGRFNKGEVLEFKMYEWNIVLFV